MRSYQLEAGDWFIEPQELVEKSMPVQDFDRASAFVYFLIHNNQIVYVGQTISLHARINQHRRDKRFDRIVWIQVTLSQLSKIEDFYIRSLRPKYNKAVGKDLFSDTMVYRHAQQKGVKSAIAKRFIKLRGNDFREWQRFISWWRKKYYAIKKDAFDDTIVDEYVKEKVSA